MFTPIELPQGLWADVVAHLWQTTIVLGVLALLAAAMRRAPARLLNALWWIGLAKLLVPVQLAEPLVKRAIDPIAAEAAAAGIRLPAITVWLDRAAPVLDPAAGGRPAVFAGASGVLLAVLWVAGAIWLGVSLARRRNSIGPAVGHEDLPPGLEDRLGAALERTHIPVQAIRVTEASVMPATVGVFRRAIVVPEVLIARLDTPELRAVLLHEDAHRRRFDPLQAAIQRAAAVAFYFFPLLWPLLSRLRETSEMACDEAAVKRGVAAPDYARALARTMSIGLEPLGLAAGLARGTPSLTRRRFDRLTNEGRFVLMRRHWLCLALAALAVIAVSASGLALLADMGEGVGGAAGEISKEQAKGIAKAMAKGVARVIAPDAPGTASTEEAAAAEQKAAAAEAAAAEREAEAAQAEESEAEAAAEEAAEEERAAAEEAAANDEASTEEKTYTITLEHHEHPEYPKDARQDGVGGKVMLKLTLSPDGKVGNVLTLEEVEGYPSLADAAELAAHEWTFKIEGDPEGEVEVIVPVEFKMHGEKTMEMSVRVPDAAEKPDEPEAPDPPDAPEPDEPPATDDLPEPAEP